MLATTLMNSKNDDHKIGYETINVHSNTIENYISSITAEEIESIGKTLIGHIIKALEINPAMVICRLTGILLDENEQVDAKTVFTEALLPMITRQIENAFKTPTTFLEKEIRLFVTHKGGLIDQIRDEPTRKFIETQANALTKKYATLFSKNTEVDYYIDLQVKKESYSDKWYFYVNEPYACKAYTLDDFQTISQRGFI